MARRTREEALETRNRILDAAERVFNEHGVSRTSLASIASAAGVTRGAVYWHFRDKTDLFDAMMQRVVLPLETMLNRSADDGVRTRSPSCDRVRSKRCSARRAMRSCSALSILRITNANTSAMRRVCANAIAQASGNARGESSRPCATPSQEACFTPRSIRAPRRSG